MSQCRIVCNTDQEDQEEESQDDSYLQVTDDDGEEGETLLVTVRWPPTMAIKTGAGDLIQQKNYTFQQRKQQRVENAVLVMLIEFSTIICCSYIIWDSPLLNSKTFVSHLS